MVKYFFFIGVLCGFSASAQLSYNDIINKHRAEINEEFKDPKSSILPVEHLENFSGLDFYMPDYNFKIQAKFKRIKKGEIIGFTTSTDRIAKYRPYGKLKFKLGGKKHSLIVYESARVNSEYKDHLFLPFTDLTNGVSTYGAGRYLDLNKNDVTKKATLDFNLCYNPYCAYSDKFSCPIPPLENHLNTEITAGVKTYGDH